MSHEPIHPLRAMINETNRREQENRAKSDQWTLGQMIAVLEQLDPALPVEGFGPLASYRGYYCDLAFEPDGETRATGSLLDLCRAAMGKIFEGYKGGDFLMGESTPLWVSPYGECSRDKLIGLDLSGAVVRPLCRNET